MVMQTSPRRGKIAVLTPQSMDRLRPLMRAPMAWPIAVARTRLAVPRTPAMPVAVAWPRAGAGVVVWCA
jgi:hypothetical protein